MPKVAPKSVPKNASRRQSKREPTPESEWTISSASSVVGMLDTDCESVTPDAHHVTVGRKVSTKAPPNSPVKVSGRIYHCEVCNKDINVSSKSGHLKSKGHLSRL